MKRFVKKTRGLIRGTSAAVVVSIAVHAGLLLLAGGFVVFTVIRKAEKKFEPPSPVQRPKMELKKPKVKVKKRVRPKASQRITSKNVQAMTSLQVPDTKVFTEGLGGGVGGFELMPDAASLSLFGSDNSVAVGNDFEGTFFSLAYDNQGHETGLSRSGVWRVIRRFHDYGWNLRTFSPYYKSPRKLFTTHFVIPPFLSTRGPKAFGIDNPDFKSVFWVVYYKGNIASRRDGQFRFWGSGDEIFVVRIDGKIVFDGTWLDVRNQAIPVEHKDELDMEYYMGNSAAWVGPWFELKAETPVEMEVLMEENGGQGCFMLSIQEKGRLYPKNRDGMPILPAFKTAEIPEPVKDRIKYTLIPGELDLDSNEMYNVY